MDGSKAYYKRVPPLIVKEVVFRLFVFEAVFENNFFDFFCGSFVLFLNLFDTFSLSSIFLSLFYMFSSLNRRFFILGLFFVLWKRKKVSVGTVTSSVRVPENARHVRFLIEMRP